MQPELITALAALGGAAVGGLTTVWATHRTNRAAADRERAQRLHDQRERTYSQAQEAVTEFLARYHAVRMSRDHRGLDALHKESLHFRAATARVQVLLPGLYWDTRQIVKSLRPDAKGDALMTEEAFLKEALAQLEELRPE